jgi:hypothetical protein
MNSYTWLVDSIDCIPSLEGKTNVVSNVHWRINATSDAMKQIKIPSKTIFNFDGSQTTIPEQIFTEPMYFVTTCGVQTLTYTSGSSFTEYEGLTLEIVIDWVQIAMGAEQVTAIQTQLEKMINDLANPSIVSPTLPWSV